VNGGIINSITRLHLVGWLFLLSHVYRVYSVAAFSWLQFVLQAMLFPTSTYAIKPTNAHVSNMFCKYYYPFTDEPQTALFKDPVRIAL